MSLLYVFCIYFGIWGCFSSEPHCSKFSYDEQLLEKLVRMEFKMEKYEESNRLVVEALKADIVKLQTLNAENVKLQAFNAEHVKLQALQADIVSLQALKADFVTLQADIDGMADELTKLRKEVNTTVDETSRQLRNLIGQQNAVVAFSAKTLRNTDPEDGETLVFTSVTTNKGNAYSGATGEFTVPIDGLYLFHDQMCLVANKDFYHQISIDDVPATLERFYANSEYPVCFTTVMTRQLQKGQKVFVKCKTHQETGKRLVDDTNRWNMFSGVLLRET